MSASVLETLESGLRKFTFAEGVQVVKRDALVVETDVPNGNIVVAVAKNTGNIVVMWDGAAQSQTVRDPSAALTIVRNVADRKQLLAPAA